MPIPLMAVPMAARAAAVAAHAAHIAAQVAPRYGASFASAAASGTLAAVLAKEAWRRLPVWVREDPAFWSYNRGSTRDGGDDDGDGRGDGEDEMAHLTSSLRKLGDWLESGMEAMGRTNLTRAQLHAATLAYVQLSVQLRFRRPEVRDSLYRILAEAHGPSQEEVEDLREMLDYSTWSYVDYYGPDVLRENLAGRGYELLSHALSDVPGRVGHFVAISKEKKMMLIGVKGTSSMEDLLTDAAGKPVGCSVGVSGDDDDCYGMDVSVEVDPNFVDVLVEWDAVEVTSGETVFVTANGTEIRCHEGVLLSARRLCDAILPTVERHAVCGKSSVVICGHSLGGAAAALLAILLRSRLPVLAERDSVRTYAFGPPPAVDADAAVNCAGHVTSVVNNSDLIPRCSVANLAVFLEVLADISDRLEERGMGLDGPKRATAFLRHLAAGAHRGEMIMSSDEYGDAVARAHKSVDIRDPSHLYVPGRVVLLYEPWANEMVRTEITAKAVDRKCGAFCTDCDSVPGASCGIAHQLPPCTSAQSRIVGAAVDFGTAPPLRFLEIGQGGRSFMDHLTTAYEASLDLLLESYPGVDVG